MPYYSLSRSSRFSYSHGWQSQSTEIRRKKKEIRALALPSVRITLETLHWAEVRSLPVKFRFSTGLGEAAAEPFGLRGSLASQTLAWPAGKMHGNSRQVSYQCLSPNRYHWVAPAVEFINDSLVLTFSEEEAHATWKDL